MRVLLFALLLAIGFSVSSGYHVRIDKQQQWVIDAAEELLEDAVDEQQEAIEENEAYTDVTDKQQLWRFLVGQGSSLTMGDRFICLRNNQGEFLYPVMRHIGAYKYCISLSRIELEFVGEKEVTFKFHELNQYISCADDGFLRVTDWKDNSTKFEIKINTNEDKIILFNPATSGTVAISSYGHLHCNGYESEPSAKFSGWKFGPKDAWEAKEEWQLIAAFDNSHSLSKTNFPYKTVVGIQRARNSKASIVEFARIKPGPDMYDAFIKNVGPDTDISWKSTPPNVWNSIVALEASTEVEPYAITKLYQGVGHYGVFTIFSNYIQARDDDDIHKTINLLET